jgi:hypothetical protein
MNLEKRYLSKETVLLFAPIFFISLNFLDPVNWPKQIALVTVLPLILRSTYLSSSKADRVNFLESWLFKLICVALGLLLVTAVMSDANLVRTLWGTWGRNNGLLTTASLVLLTGVFAFHCSLSEKNVTAILKTLLLGISISSVYGLLQSFDADPVSWSTTGQVFGPFGNTNFASLCWGLGAALSMYFIFFQRATSKSQIIYICQFIALTYSIQGLVIIVLGTLLFTFIYISQKEKKRNISIIYLGITFIGLFISGLGMLGFGPFSSFLYQYTLELRGYYWLAGIRMGLSDILFGVGVDSYGDFFRLHRPFEAAVATGVDLTTNNAHNSLIQLFATLGLVGSGTILILWMLGLIIAGRVFIDKKESVQRRATAVILILLWLTSAISIDNIAVATLNYLFLGMILSHSIKSRIIHDREVAKQDNRTIVKNLNPWRFFPVSLIFLSSILFSMSMIMSSPDRQILSILERPAFANDPNSLESRRSSLMELSENSNMMETHFVYVTRGLSELNYLTDALAVSNKSLTRFPNSFGNLDLSAVILERTNEWSRAAEIRERQLNLEPRHPLIWLNYAIDLKQSGDLVKARSAYAKALQFKILAFDSNLSYLLSLEEDFK